MGTQYIMSHKCSLINNMKKNINFVQHSYKKIATPLNNAWKEYSGTITHSPPPPSCASYTTFHLYPVSLLGRSMWLTTPYYVLGFLSWQTSIPKCFYGWIFNCTYSALWMWCAQNLESRRWPCLKFGWWCLHHLNVVPYHHIWHCTMSIYR